MKKILCVLSFFALNPAYAGMEYPTDQDLEKLATDCRVLANEISISSEMNDQIVLSCVTDLIDLDLSATNVVLAD